MKRLVAALALPFAVAACGDNLKGTSVDADIDAEIPIDAQEIDAPPPPAVTGTISLQEVKLLNPGNSGTLFGQGPQASITFVRTADVPAALMEEQPGSPLGCKAYSYNPAQTAAAVLGVDEGPVQFTATAGTAPLPNFPACVFQAGLGYVCPHTATAHVGGTVTAAVGGVATLTDTDVTYNDGNSIGRYVSISGAANPLNNGAFPIVGRPGPNTIAYGNQVAAAETLPAAATHINLAAVGPTPMAPDPGFMANDVALTVDHAMGGGNNVPAFTSTTAPGTIGDDTGISMNELRKLNAVPLDGTAFTVSCDSNCGTASGSILILRTTDASTAAVSPFALPPPVTKRIEVRCAAIGQTAVTVPAAYMAQIMTSGATRVQATFIRPTLMGGGPATINVISGHAWVGYTNRP